LLWEKNAFVSWPVKKVFLGFFDNSAKGRQQSSELLRCGG